MFKALYSIVWWLALGCVSLVVSLPMTAHANSVPPAKLTSELHWRSIGPYRGGRSIAVSGVVQQPGVFYMGAVGGGVWKSTNYGHTWKNVSDPYFGSNNIGALTVAPSDPNIIYVGTGESDIRNTLLTGDGMYKSTNAGKTWTHIGLADTHIISRIVVDPDNSNVVYAAAMGHVWAPNPERGVYKSTDGGRHWKKILFVNNKTGAIDLVMNPSNPQILYAAMWQAYRRHWTLSSGGPGSGIYKSTDGGTTWTNITHKPGLPTGIFGKIGLAIAPSAPNIMYAVIQAKYKGQAGGVFRSDNAGQSWKLVNNSMELTQRAFYYMTAYVDPKNPNTVYFPQVAALWVTHDGGKTISKISTPHGDNHTLWIDPNNPDIMAEANDGGATVSRDGGKVWTLELNQPTGQFYHVNLDDQFPFNVYGAQQDEGSIVGPSATRSGSIPFSAWQPVQGGESAWVVPQPGKPWITYTSGYYDNFWKENRKTGFVQKISPWDVYNSGAPASQLKYRSNWIHRPILFALNNPNFLLIATQYVLKSTNQGAIWMKLSPDLTRHDKSKEGEPGGPISADATGAELYDTISALAISPLNDNIIWSGSDDGLVYVTTDGGGRWKQVTPKGLPTWVTVTCIEASHTNPGTAYVTASHYQWDDFKPYVYRTTDYGKHWTALTSGLPNNQYLESIRQDPNDANLLFLATSKTVYMSLDNGSHWLPLTLNLPTVRVSDIAIQSAQHAIVLATHGRAFWILDNLGFLEQLSRAQVASNAPYLFVPQQAWLVTRRNGSFGAHRPVGQNPLPGVSVFFYLPAGYDGQTPVKLGFTTTQGKPINSYTLSVAGKKGAKKQTLHAGMNRFQWNMRYPSAIDVKGYYIPRSPACGEYGTLEGPEVIPGTYDATLSYGGATLKQPFKVRLDPRIPTTQQQLQQRFALLMKIRGTVDRLDAQVNQAIDTRSKLQKAVADGHVSSSRAKHVLAALDRDITAMAQLKIQSDEGDAVYVPMIHDDLTYLTCTISGSGYGPLTPEDTGIYQYLTGKAHAGEMRLQADIKEANATLNR